MFTADNTFCSYSHNKTMQTLECCQLEGMWVISEDISNNYDDYHKSIKGIVISHILRKVTTAAIKIHTWQNKPKIELCRAFKMEKSLTSKFQLNLEPIFFCLILAALCKTHQEWTEHCRGQLVPNTDRPFGQPTPISVWGLHPVFLRMLSIYLSDSTAS